jgi:hypothetical protein
MHVHDGGTTGNFQNTVPFFIKKIMTCAVNMTVLFFEKRQFQNVFLFSRHLKIRQLHLVSHLLLT